MYTLVQLYQKAKKDPHLLDTAMEFEKMLKRKCESQGDVSKVIDTLFNSSGIEVADKLSIEHIKQSIVNLEEIYDHKISGSKNLHRDP